MKQMYLDIIEKSLDAYSQERIRDYIEEVKRDGLKEHGFPRLGVNIGILIINGRRTELLDTFIEIMDICCKEMPEKKAQNDFSIREVCCCLKLFEERNLINRELLNKWKESIKSFDPWSKYNVVVKPTDTFVANWALFAAVSDYVRGEYCGIDTSQFVDWQLASQVANFDSFDMYKDEAPDEENPPTNPVVYDLVPRVLFAFLLCYGYNGKYKSRIEQMLDNTTCLTLKMQSVTGETAFGGRSNQFLHNDTLLCSYFELEALRFKKKGDLIMAGELKTAAKLAALNVLKYLNLSPISHIKNRYDITTKIGCEDYAYFNKYMITTASNIYYGALFSDDSITETKLSNKSSGYVFSTSEDFNKTFLSAGGYFTEVDTKADFHYDANGLGRVHKTNCSSVICLSLPFAPNPNYILEDKNKGAMSICCYCEKEGRKFIGAESYAKYSLAKSESDAETASAVFNIEFPYETIITQEIKVSESGVDLSLFGVENSGFMVPVFDYDGHSDTEIKIEQNCISVKYENSVCVYKFEGKLSEDFEYYYNRNGRYRVYSVDTKNLHIEIEKCEE